MHLPMTWKGLVLPLHALLEGLGYAIGYQIYRQLRKKRGDFLAPQLRFSLVVAAILGALVGSKIPGLADHLFASSAAIPWLASKTVVGGLLGGFWAVEVVKWRHGISRATGNLWVWPVIVGMGLGRLGCFLAGPADGTWGLPTTLPWGVDPGDGLARHPAPLYEMLFLAGAGLCLTPLMRRHPQWNGYRLFLFAYLIFRLTLDTLKSDPRVAWGLSSIQWACLVGMAYMLADFRKFKDEPVAPSPPLPTPSVRP